LARNIRPPRKVGFVHSRGFKALIIIVSVLVLLFVASEIAIPLVADAYIKNKLKERYPTATDVSVSIGAFPELMLAFKKYSHLEVIAGSITVEDVKLDRVKLTSKSWPMAQCEAWVGQGEINRVFTPKSGQLLNPAITLQPDTVRVSGRLKTLRLIDVEAVGKLRVTDGRYVYFDATEVGSPQRSLSASEKATVTSLISQNPIFVVREDLPFTITAIAVEDGLLHVSGVADMEKAFNIHL